MLLLVQWTPHDMGSEQCADCGQLTFLSHLTWPKAAIATALCSHKLCSLWAAGTVILVPLQPGSTALGAMCLIHRSNLLSMQLQTEPQLWTSPMHINAYLSPGLQCKLHDVLHQHSAYGFASVLQGQTFSKHRKQQAGEPPGELMQSAATPPTCSRTCRTCQTASVYLSPLIQAASSTISCTLA